MSNITIRISIDGCNQGGVMYLREADVRPYEQDMLKRVMRLAEIGETLTGLVKHCQHMHWVKEGVEG
jgi:hypothetical protein